MRQTLLILTALELLFSCTNADPTKVASDTTTVKQQKNTTPTKPQRQLLIEEIKRLQAVFASGDKSKIADIFEFPLSDTSLSIYINDSTFNAQYEKNDNRVTRALFIRFFTPISESLQTDEINRLFQHLKINDLLQKDSLEYNALIKTEPCYHFYGIDIANDLVTLTVGTNSNKDYKSKSASDDEIPENSSELCEHVLWWVFRFDGRRLNLVKIHGAG